MAFVGTAQKARRPLARSLNTKLVTGEILMSTNEILGQISQVELSEMIRRHEEWLSDPKRGRKLDLFSVDLGGLRLEGNLSKSVFRRCRLDFSLLKDCILDSTTFTDCMMNDVHFESCSSSSGLVIKDSTLIHSLFDRGLYVHAKISGSRFDNSSFPSVSIKESDVSDSNFSDCGWTKGSFYKSEFRSTIFNKSTFKEFYMNEARFNICEIKEVDFTNVVEMKGIDLSESNLEKSIIENKNLSVSEASFRENNCTQAKLNNSIFNEQRMYASVFDGAEVNKTSFSQCILDGASFVGAKGSEISFSLAKLYGANFTDATFVLSFWEGAHASRAIFLRTNLKASSLKFSDLSNSSMHSANIENVQFGGCNLSGVAWPSGGVCEPGSIGQCNLKPHPVA